MKWNEFRIGDVLNFDSSNGIFHAININIEEQKSKNNHPYVVRTSQNNGVRGYIKEDENKLNPPNTISFAQDTAQMFYQKEAYFTGNKVKIISVKDRLLNERIAIFLIACMNKAFSSFAWGSSYDTEILRNVAISLPVKTAIIPDFSLMSKIYSGGGISMSNIDTSAWREFKLEELFGKPTRGTRLIKENRIPGNIPLVTAGFNNEGIAEYIDNDEQQTFSHGITIDMFGNCFYRDYAFKADDNILVFGNQDIPEKAKLFIVTCINKITNGMYSYGQQFRMTAYNNTTIKLPVKETEEIDWEFMEDYIKAIQKIVIKDVVKYKDEVIAKTKEAVAG